MKKGKLNCLLFVIMGLACAGLGFGFKNESYAAAVSSGGALYFGANTSGTISGIIDGATVSEAGGGVFVGSGANVTLTSTGVIKNCSAGPGAPGGAVYLNGGKFNLSGTIQDCSDGGYGGAAVFMDGGTLNLWSAGKLVEFESSYHSLFRLDGGFANLAEGFTFSGCTGHNYLFYIDGGELSIENMENLVGPFRASEKIYAKSLTSFLYGDQGTIKFPNGGGFTGKITSDYTYPFVVGVWDTPSSSAQYNFVDVPTGKEGYPIAYLDSSSYFNASNWNVEGYDVELGTYDGCSAVLLRSKGYTLSFDLGIEYETHNQVDTYALTGWNTSTRTSEGGDITIDILDEDTLKLNGSATSDRIRLSVCEVFIPTGSIFKAETNAVSGYCSGEFYVNVEWFDSSVDSVNAWYLEGDFSQQMLGYQTHDPSNDPEIRWVTLDLYIVGYSEFDDFVVDLKYVLYSDVNFIADAPVEEMYFGAELPSVSTPGMSYLDNYYGGGYLQFEGYYTGKNGTGQKIYYQDGTPIPSEYNYDSSIVLYGHWERIPIAEIKIYTETLNNMILYTDGYNIGESVWSEEFGEDLHLTKFYTHQNSSGLNCARADEGSFFVQYGVGAETALGCVENREWRQYAITFEDDNGYKSLQYRALGGYSVDFFSCDGEYQLDLILEAHRIPLYFSTGNTGATLSSSYVTAYYMGEIVVTSTSGILKIYTTSGSLITTITPTLSSGYSSGYWKVYNRTTGHTNNYFNYGDSMTITSLDGYTFTYYAVKTASKTVTITYSGSGLNVNGSSYSASSPTYQVTSGSTLTLAMSLPGIDNTNMIVGPDGSYKRHYKWSVTIDGEEVYTRINPSSTDTIDSYSLSVTSNINVTIVREVITLISAIYALPDLEYGEIEQDKELEIISCLYDDKRYWLDKKYLTTVNVVQAEQADLFQLEKYQIGAIETQL